MTKLTIGPIPAYEASEVRRLASQHGCKLTEKSTGWWPFKEWSFTIEGGELAHMERDLIEAQREWFRWKAIR